MDRVSQLMAWEAGSLSHDEEVALFQSLIDDGTAWSLQGAYGRRAQALIDGGECQRPTPKYPPVARSETVGPYVKVSRDQIVDFGAQGKFRVLVAGGYNANGLIGHEFNGVVVLSETNMNVVADRMGEESSGYYGPSAKQIKLFMKLTQCSWDEFQKTVNESPQLRYPI